MRGPPNQGAAVAVDSDAGQAVGDSAQSEDDHSGAVSDLRRRPCGDRRGARSRGLKEAQGLPHRRIRQDAVAAEYAKGTLIRRLAVSFDISCKTIRNLLSHRGIRIRSQAEQQAVC